MSAKKQTSGKTTKKSNSGRKSTSARAATKSRSNPQPKQPLLSSRVRAILFGLAAALFSILSVFIQNSFGRYSGNRILYTMIVSAIVGTGIGILCRAAPVFNRPMVMIGDIMLLNPGVTMINAVREMMVGNTISGEIRLIESTTWALALAAGFMLAIHLTA